MALQIEIKEIKLDDEQNTNLATELQDKSDAGYTLVDLLVMNDHIKVIHSIEV